MMSRDSRASVSNETKEQVWRAYYDRRPVRVPVVLGINARVVILDPAWNREGVTFEEYFIDASAIVTVQLRLAEFLYEYAHRYCDRPVGLPDEFALYVDVQNCYDAAYFGSPLTYRDGQVPDCPPILAGSAKHRIFEQDIEHPLDNPFLRRELALHSALERAAAGRTHRGMRLSVRRFQLGFDGAFTIAMALRGGELLADLYEDPDYVRRLLAFIQRGVILRREALARRIGAAPFDAAPSHADDSIQLISVAMYREFVLPLHRQWYALWRDEPGSMHLCGDATRHFPTIHRELGVESFDTGFPVDFGGLRRQLGPDVEICGGPEVGLLLGGTPQQVGRRTREILRSGVTEGGRFILREGNNLPPCVPEANLAAMYRACLECGADVSGP